MQAENHKLKANIDYKFYSIVIVILQGITVFN
jgi:hypothetical protein